MADIVIVGAGIGGMPMAFEMKELARKEDKVIVINEHDYFQFTPSNPWLAVDWRKREELITPIPKVLKKLNIEFVKGLVVRVEPDQNRLELASGEHIHYDHLVLAPGPKLAFDEIEGLGPDQYTHSICNVGHANHARDRWLEFVKKPGPIVTGAVQMASCFGPAYEFAFIMDKDLRNRKIRDQVPMTFVTSEPYIGHLGLNGVGDSKTLLESELRQRHIDFICNAKVAKVDAQVMHVEQCDDNGNVVKHHELPFDYSMMLPAFTGIDAIQGIEGLVNPRGFVIVDEYQCNPTFRNIWGVGVAVAIAPKCPTPVPTGVPKTGFMIESMVTATAHNIRARLSGEPETCKASWNAVCLADMGDTGLAFVAIPQIPPRNVSWMKGGKWVHLAKIGFEKYFMHKIKTGKSEPIYEKVVMKSLGIGKLK